MLFNRTQSDVNLTSVRSVSHLVAEFENVRNHLENFQSMMAAYASGNAVPPELLSQQKSVAEYLSSLQNSLTDVLGSDPYPLTVDSLDFSVILDDANQSISDFENSFYNNAVSSQPTRLIGIAQTGDSGNDPYRLFIGLPNSFGHVLTEASAPKGSSGVTVLSSADSTNNIKRAYVFFIEMVKRDAVNVASDILVMFHYSNPGPQTVAATHVSTPGTWSALNTVSHEASRYFLSRALALFSIPLLIRGLNSQVQPPTSWPSVVTNDALLPKEFDGVAAILRSLEPFKSITNYVNSVSFID